jgi:hypothetical protein
MPVAVHAGDAFVDGAASGFTNSAPVPWQYTAQEPPAPA